MFSSRFLKPASRAFSTSASRFDVARMTLLGRVGATPLQQESRNGNVYLKYPLAVTTNKDQTSWFNIVAFEPKLIEFVTKYVDKGSLVYLEAEASISKYTTDDGTTRSSLTLVQQSISPITWPKRASETEGAEGLEHSQEQAI